MYWSPIIDYWSPIMGGIWEGSERLGVPRASQGDLSHASSYMWCHSRRECKSSLKMLILLCVFEGHITVDGYLKQLRATGAADALPNPPRALTNTVRTPTAKSCLGKISYCHSFCLGSR